MANKQSTLQRQLAITPKTAELLIRMGYGNYRDLKDATPNQLTSKLVADCGMPKSLASGYRRGFRRMVYLATTDEPELHAKELPDWTNKALVARGVWRDDWDDLTGVQAAALLDQSPPTAS